MKSYREITGDLEEYLGRRLTDDEQDYCFIMQLCGSWGFSKGVEADTYLSQQDIAGCTTGTLLEGLDAVRSQYSSATGTRSPAAGDYRYMLKTGNPIQWQRIREAAANQIVGIFLVPERTGKDICCAQFVGRVNKRIWINIQQAESIALDMVRGMSFASAVDKNL